LVDLAQWVAKGVLQILDLAETETRTFVTLATEIEDGEAATLTIAAHRRLDVATDDRKARRVADRLGLPEPVRTSQLLPGYCTGVDLPDGESAELLRAVEQRARFRPPASDPLNLWWAKARIG
jgi:hypothetical protein